MSGRVAERWENRLPVEWQRAWRVPELHIYDVIGSTNDVARERAHAGAPAGTTVLADHQSAGRGRAGRSWNEAQGQGVLLSVLFRGSRANLDTSVMPLRVGLAVATAIEQVAGLRVLLKWPNDLLLPSMRKLGGILCEGASLHDSPWLVAGIGINVLQTPDDFPEHIRDTATSLHAAGANVSRPELVRAILDSLRPFRILPPPLDSATLRQIAHRDALQGHQVVIDGIHAGIAAGIGPDGTLVIETENATQRIRNGTVRIVAGPHADARQ